MCFILIIIVKLLVTENICTNILDDFGIYVRLHHSKTEC